jgi:hypothetical protein
MKRLLMNQWEMESNLTDTGEMDDIVPEAEDDAVNV